MNYCRKHLCSNTGACILTLSMSFINHSVKFIPYISHAVVTFVLSRIKSVQCKVAPYKLIEAVDMNLNPCLRIDNFFCLCSVHENRAGNSNIGEISSIFYHSQK